MYLRRFLNGHYHLRFVPGEEHIKAAGLWFKTDEKLLGGRVTLFQFTLNIQHKVGGHIIIIGNFVNR